ncbi:Eco57I restriction-modification methylase domain-containing protein, partial [Polynucleobacter sp.]|uniref:Eco57I restriction-modification methylase domain-containing protein n=1 Tax=Polynucleobacter sp. TaxID=2029855 RepID=UPI003F6A4782
MAFSDPALEARLAQRMGKASTPSGSMISGTQFSDPALEQRLKQRMSQPRQQRQQAPQPVAQAQPIIAKPKSRLDPKKEALKWAANTGLNLVQGFSKTAEYAASTIGKQLLDTVVKKNPVTAIASLTVPKQYKKLNDQWKDYIRKNEQKLPAAQVSKAVEKLSQNEYLQPSKEWQQAQQTDWKKLFTKEHLPETILQVSPSIVSSIITAISTGGSGVFITTAGSTAQDVKSDAINYGVSEGKAESLGLATGLAVGYLDKALPDKLFGDPAVKQAFLKGILRKLGNSVLLEAGTETTQEAVQLAAEKTFRDDLGWEEAKTRAALSAFGGAFGGGAMQTVASFFNKTRTEIIEDDQTMLDYLKEKTGSATLTPQQAMGTIVGTPLENTPEGNEVMKVALQAQDEDKQVKITTSEGKVTAEIVDPVQNQEPQDVRKEFIEKELQPKEETVDPNLASIRTTEDGSTVIRPENIRDGEVAGFKELEKSPDKMIDDFIAKFGNKVGADEAKTMFDGYNETNSMDYDRVSGALSQAVLDRLIIEAGNKPGSVLIMSGGGTGSGKSSTLRNYVSNSGPFYDSTFSSIDRAVKNTENALANGLDVDVHFVYRNPVEAFKDGVMQRYRDGEARTVPVSRHLSSHENAIKTILEYSDKYEDNPKVNVQIYRNVTGQKAKVIPIDTLRELDYNSLEYKKELEGYVEKEYQDGNITREQAAALLERKIRDDVKNDERKPQETRPAKSKPAKVVAKTSPQEELKQKYQENQQAVEEALSQVWTELDAAQAGSRVTIDGKVQGIKSTFPSWVPEYFRSRDLFDATLARLATVLDNPEYPPTSKPKLRDLYDVILDQIDYVAEIDTRDIRNKLLEASDAKTNKTKDTTIARKDDSSPKRAEAAEPKQKPEKESIIDSNEKESSNQTTRPQDKPGDSPETVSESPGKQAMDRGADSDSSGKVAGRRRSDSDKRLGDGSSAPVNQVELNKQIEDLVNERGDNPNKYSDEEKKLLKRYTGSGGLEKQGATGKGLLDEYYTPKEIVNEIWQRLETIGYGKQDIVAVVEPAIGIGSFIDRNMDGHRVIGFETNPISAKIARIVNDDKPIQVHNQSFEEVFMSNRGVPVSVEPFADLVVGNPPYGKHRGLFKGLGEEPKIKSYEEYFVKRGLDVLKDGGLLAYVMPSTWLNSDISYGKQAIASMGELVEAFRLPKGAFKTTSIGTDIVIFKKGGTTNLSDLTNGTYFADNPDAVLGTVSVGTGQWGSDEVKGTLDDAIERMRSYEKPAKVAEVVEDPENIAEIIEEQRQEKIQADEESQSTEEPPTDNKTIAPKVKADVANKALITTTKKGKTMLVSDGLSNDDLTIWSSVTATGELNQEYTKNFKPEAFESEQVFIDMSSGSAEYFPSVTYVAGNIYEKLDQLESFKDSIFPGQYTRQKKALEAAIPATISVKEMTLQPNSRYVKEIQFTNEDGEQTSLREMFIKYVQKLPMQAFGSSSSWEIVGYVQGTVVNSGDKVRNVEIRKRRRELGKQLFKRFIIEELSDDQQKIIEKAFNRNFNGYYRPDYTKIPLVSKVFTTFNPKQKKVVDKLEVKPIQKEGAAFLASKGVGLLAYDVGVGKTLTGIVAINEVMQRGWAKKPLIIVPNSTYQNWINEILELIPGVKINSLKNLGGGFKGDLNTLEIEDGTLSIMTYEGLNKLGFKDETYNEIGKDLKDVMSGFNTTKRGEESEGAKADEMTGIAAKGTSSERFFEDLGFDHITVDEVHNFKNIFAGAKLEGERGGNEYRNIR